MIFVFICFTNGLNGNKIYYITTTPNVNDAETQHVQLIHPICLKINVDKNLEIILYSVVVTDIVILSLCCESGGGGRPGGAGDHTTIYYSQTQAQSDTTTLSHSQSQHTARPTVNTSPGQRQALLRPRPGLMSSLQ